MAETLQEAFNKSVQRYIEVPGESDEEISIEYNNVGSEKKQRPRTNSQNAHVKKEDKKSGIEVSLLHCIVLHAFKYEPNG